MVKQKPFIKFKIKQKKLNDRYDQDIIVNKTTSL